MKNEWILRIGHAHAIERFVLNGVEIVNALQRISTRRLVLTRHIAEISTIVRRGRASVLQSIHIGCTRNCLGVEAKAVKANVWTVYCFGVVL